MSTDEKKPLGRILLQQKLVSQRDLDQALKEQARQSPEHPTPLASRLTDRGVLSELDALRALSQQHGVPGIDLTQIAILTEHLDLIPREMAEAQLILPALVHDDRIFLAMASPSDKRVTDELEFVTGKKVYPYVALSTTIEKTIRAAYEAKAAGNKYYLGPNVPLETLNRLGLTIPPGPGVGVEEQAPSERPLARPASDSVAPGAPGVVVDEAMEKAGFEAELETGQFGALAREEVSTVQALPDELRGAAPSLRAPRAMSPGSALVREETPAPAEPKVSRPAHALASKVILVVDDEEDIRKLLKRLLSDKGHRVVEGDRGLLALRLVKEHTPDLIILDAMLPELHGFDIARRIKGSEKYGHIPIIMVSAVYRGWRIAEDLKNNYGIEEYIEKPFRITDLLQTVQRLLADRDQKKRDAPSPPRDMEAISAEAEKALADGIAAYKGGRIDEAIVHLARGVQIDPLAYRLRYHLALLYGKKGLIYEGIAELERAADLNPKHFPAMKNLAVLYEKAGFKHKAVEMWERCASLAPDEATRESVKKHLIELL